MSSVRDRVKAAIDELDPEGLLRIGAPADEYDPEIDDFAQQIAQGLPMTLERVTATWNRWFKGCIGARRPDVMAELAAALANASRQGSA